MAPRWTQRDFMFMLDPRDKANLLIMTTRSNLIRHVYADFDALALPHWILIYKNWSEHAKVAYLLYMRDFMQIWYATRAMSRGFRLAADALWFETNRHFVLMRMNRDTSDAILTAMDLESSTSASEV